MRLTNCDVAVKMVPENSTSDIAADGLKEEIDFMKVRVPTYMLSIV